MKRKLDLIEKWHPGFTSSKALFLFIIFIHCFMKDIYFSYSHLFLSVLDSQCVLNLMTAVIMSYSLGYAGIQRQKGQAHLWHHSLLFSVGRLWAKAAHILTTVIFYLYLWGSNGFTLLSQYFDSLLDQVKLVTSCLLSLFWCFSAKSVNASQII